MWEFRCFLTSCEIFLQCKCTRFLSEALSLNSWIFVNEKAGKSSYPLLVLTQRQTPFTQKRGRGGKTTSERGCGSRELPLHPFLPPSTRVNLAELLSSLTMWAGTNNQILSTVVDRANSHGEVRWGVGVCKKEGSVGGMSEAPCQSAQNSGALKWGPPSHSQSLLRSRGQGLQGGLRLPREYTKERELKRCLGLGRVYGRGTGGGRGKKAVV